MAKDLPFETALRETARLVAARAPGATHAIAELKHHRPDHPAGCALAARFAHQSGQFGLMLKEARAALNLAPSDRDLTRLVIEALIFSGDHGAAQSLARATIATVQDDPLELQRLAEIMAHEGCHEVARAANYRAATVRRERSGQDDPQALYNLASAEIALGHIADARVHLDRVLAINPNDHDARYNRATLSRATPQANSTREMTALLAGRLRHPMDEVRLCHAIAKEEEDLGNHAAAFSHVMRGARARRRLLSYDVQSDVAAMERIAQTFDASWFAAPAAVPQHGPVPIFILGLPRSGTTLVDRIISSLGGVASLGEINDFALALTEMAGGSGDKADLVSRARQIDPAALGADYRRRVASFGRQERFLIDKTPLNFLYIGLIARSLPDARIVHVRRGAMDNAWAMLKTLFRMGYPFSYALDDLAAYMIAKDRLMAHWRRHLGERLIEIDYEALVARQEAESRRLAHACGLAWNDAALSFHASKLPVATASAIQVRRPINQDSVGLWRHHRDGLAPLADAFTGAGIALEVFDQ